MKQEVQKSYDSIAKEFSQTRNYAWPEFAYFEPYVQKGMKVLDLGCGNGRVYEYLQQKNIDYTGFDLSQGLLDEAQKKYPETTFVQGNMVSLPFEDNTFDQVWSIASFHHLQNQTDRKQCLAEIRRVLKPGGKLLMTSWNLLQKKYRSQLFKNIVSCKWMTVSIYDFNIPWKNADGSVKADRYYHAFTPSRLRRLLQNAGFEMVDEFYTRKKEKVRFLESFNICVVCENF